MKSNQNKSTVISSPPNWDHWGTHSTVSQTTVKPTFTMDDDPVTDNLTKRQKVAQMASRTKS